MEAQQTRRDTGTAIYKFMASILMVILPPVGISLMWSKQLWDEQTRKILTGASVTLFVIVAVLYAASPEF